MYVFMNLGGGECVQKHPKVFASFDDDNFVLRCIFILDLYI